MESGIEQYYSTRHQSATSGQSSGLIEQSYRTVQG